MSKNRFNNDKVVRLELKDGDWIEVRQTLGWDEFEPVYAQFTTKGIKAVKDLLKLVLKKWNFTNGEKEMELTHENIDALDILTLAEISDLITPLYFPEKKSSAQSDRELLGKIEKPNVMLKS